MCAPSTSLGKNLVCTFACAHLTSRANRNSSRQSRAMSCSGEFVKIPVGWSSSRGMCSRREDCFSGAGKRIFGSTMMRQLIKLALTASAGHIRKSQTLKVSRGRILLDLILLWSGPIPLRFMYQQIADSSRLLSLRRSMA